MVKEIKRDYYLEQLINREGNGLIKIVTGIRIGSRGGML